jgi:hypothetical protein
MSAHESETAPPPAEQHASAAQAAHARARALARCALRTTMFQSMAHMKQAAQ